MAYDVIGVGESSVDYVYRLPHYPEPAGPHAKMPISAHAISCGGQVATALCTCAGLGLRVKYIGSVGADDNGRRIRAALIARGVDVSDLVERAAPSRFAVILVAEGRGERIVLWDRSPELALRPQDLAEDVLRRARLVHVDDTDPEAALHAATVARRAGAHVTSDIDRATARTEELIGAVTVALLAERVAEELTGESDVERALRKLRRVQAGPICVTRGARGAVLLEGDRLYDEPGLQVDAVDTTGAGDVFRGAFIYALLQGEAPASILRFANAAAALSCTRPGAIDAVPTLADIRGALARAALPEGREGTG